MGKSSVNNNITIKVYTTADRMKDILTLPCVATYYVQHEIKK